MAYNRNTKGNTYLKTMRNTNISDRDQPERSHWKSSWVVDIHSTDKIKLNKFMNAELTYYNNLVDSFNSRLRCQPETILSLTGEWEKLFGVIAETGFKLYTLRNAPVDHPLTPELEPFRDLLLGRTKEKKRYLSETLLVLLDTASLLGTILPSTRKYMALEILRYYKEQAKHSTQEIKGTGLMEGSTYKNNFCGLEKFDNTRKRHVQIPKEALKYQYTSEKILKIWTPYSSLPIEIPEFGNVDEKPWNLLVIHQQPGEVSTQLSPWIVEFKNAAASYLIKLVEVSNPYLSSKNWRVAKNR